MQRHKRQQKRSNKHASPEFMEAGRELGLGLVKHIFQADGAHILAKLCEHGRSVLSACEGHRGHHGTCVIKFRIEGVGVVELVGSTAVVVVRVLVVVVEFLVIIRVTVVQSQPWGLAACGRVRRMHCCRTGTCA
ncbi:hypothetical protein CAOG_009379 [Capsaspora owczarzaki ATCC 30864]|uniref:Uncharacterized protein n=1 Tax=Capsaspora owczarzaki (strain ATCC 30864) TaxID=595528 RepID=A0A0D2WJR0_CAPO3|nr:hypothetical protein CAOG_009379 [Capsaspora owczarzaki ATCC 30864]